MGTMIEFTAAGQSFQAYRADPPGPARGAVLVVHEIWGLVPHIKDVADRLAAEGFLAVAPDVMALAGLDAVLMAELGERRADPAARDGIQPTIRAAMAPVNSPDSAARVMAGLAAVFNYLDVTPEGCRPDVRNGLLFWRDLRLCPGSCGTAAGRRHPVLRPCRIPRDGACHHCLPGPGLLRSRRRPAHGGAAGVVGAHGRGGRRLPSHGVPGRRACLLQRQQPAHVPLRRRPGIMAGGPGLPGRTARRAIARRLPEAARCTADGSASRRPPSCMGKISRPCARSG
ncbi:hypothetical protein CVV67_09290 [Arthrobacter stackebrandtii]|nr:hypothetical protein CVV67_09290 [Arthrobacter stackebrandtii]